MEVNVDERGRYTREMGYELEGKNVLGEGTKKVRRRRRRRGWEKRNKRDSSQVLELLKKDVVMTTKYVHSYPYDWRTKKVVRGGGGERIS